MHTGDKSKKGTPWPRLGLFPALVIAGSVLIAACAGGDDGDEPSLISEGAGAPDFTLPAARGESVNLSDLVTKKNALLYFSMGSG